MSKSQVEHDMKIQGGFLPLLAGLASQALPFLTGTIVPALGVGALSGLASTGVQKLVGHYQILVYQERWMCMRG